MVKTVGQRRQFLFMAEAAYLSLGGSGSREAAMSAQPAVSFFSSSLCSPDPSTHGKPLLKFSVGLS